LVDAGELEKRFQIFAAAAARFSREVLNIAWPNATTKSQLAESNLRIAKAVFGKWCIEILVVLHNLGPFGFENLRRGLGAITPRVLSRKLAEMEHHGLVRRKLVGSRPPGVIYSLTRKGSTVARLGEPVFLYLGFKIPYDQG